MDSSRTTTSAAEVVIFSGDEEVFSSGSDKVSMLNGLDRSREIPDDDEEKTDGAETRQFFQLPPTIQTLQPQQAQLQAQLQQAQIQARLHQAHILQIQSQLQKLRQQDEKSPQRLITQDTSELYAFRKNLVDGPRRTLKEGAFIPKSSYGTIDSPKQPRISEAQHESGPEKAVTTKKKENSRPLGDLVDFTDEENAEEVVPVIKRPLDRSEQNIPFLLSQSPLVYNLEATSLNAKSLDGSFVPRRFIPEAPKSLKKPSTKSSSTPSIQSSSPPPNKSASTPAKTALPFISIYSSSAAIPPDINMNMSNANTRDAKPRYKKHRTELTTFVASDRSSDEDITDEKGAESLNREGGPWGRGLFGSDFLSGSPQVYNLDREGLPGGKVVTKNLPEEESCIYLGETDEGSEVGDVAINSGYLFSGV